MAVSKQYDWCITNRTFETLNKKRPFLYIEMDVVVFRSNKYIKLKQSDIQSI